MQLQKGQIVDLEIDSLAFGGSGIGRHEGRAVFVPKTMPGDKVKASFRRIKEKYAEAELVEIIEESSERVDPKCRYSGVCGGCSVQFMPYDQQLKFKKQQVIDCLERIGKVENPPVKDVLGAEESFYYRNKMEFSFGYDAEMKFAFGMHVPGRRFDKMNLQECHLQSEVSYQIVNAVRDFILEIGWPPYKVTNGRGFLKSLFIREGKRTGEMMIILRTSHHLPKNLEEGMKGFVEMLLGLSEKIDFGDKAITSIHWMKVISKRGQKTKIEEECLYGNETLTERMKLPGGDSLEFEIRPQAFFQVNTFQGEVLYQEVLNLIEQEDRKLIFDLFCGTGTIGLFMARHAEKVMGIEINEESVAAAKINAEKNGVDNIDFFCGDVADVLKNIEDKPSLIVVDPPRAGLTKKAIEYIDGFETNKLIYVSCNPATLARDCQELSEYGFQLKSVQPVDMFPHTFHIENVCLLER